MQVNSLTKTELKVILNEVLTPFLNNLGLNKYDREYLWFSDFNQEGIKHVFKYQLLKGDTGTIVYGNCFEFMQTIGNNKVLKNHRTDKSTTLHLFELSDGWKQSLYRGQKLEDKVKQTNIETTTLGLNQIIQKYQNICQDWWVNSNTIDGNIQIALEQIRIGESKINSPSPQMTLIYLYWKLGEHEKSKEQFELQRNLYISHDKKYEEVFKKIEYQLFK